MEKRPRYTEEDMRILQEEIRELKETAATLRQEVKQDEATLQALREEVLEVKIRRIVMEEITRDSRESMLRNLGYAESFYGYPDRAKIEAPDKEEETQSE